MSDQIQIDNNDNNENNAVKKITITGTHNKYEMKKVTTKRDSYKKESNEEKEKKKRIVSGSWSFTPEKYEYDKQIEMMKNIKNNNYHSTDEISKIALQEINKKIYSYKQQDNIKKIFNQEDFVHLETIIDKMVECELKCYYCQCEMSVLYDISREMKQWSVDRINNDLGHNKDNFYLACLECNLKRRRRSDEKFLFTKQLKLVKIDE